MAEEREIRVEEIPGGWAARQGRLAAHGQTREEALRRLRAVQKLTGRDEKIEDEK